MNQKSTITWSIVVVVVIAIGLGAWYLMQQPHSLMTPTVGSPANPAAPANSTTTQNSGEAIASFSISAAAQKINGVINATHHTVSLVVPEGTDLANLKPTITVSANATVSPASGTAENFIEPVIYTVKGQNGVRQEYTVTATIVPYSIKIRSVLGIGSFLTDANGLTLYYFLNDTPGSGKSACTGQCEQLWPPFYTATIMVANPLEASSFSLVTRTDGKQQLAYKGHPLYYYAKESSAGTTDGEGIGKVWYVVQP